MSKAKAQSKSLAVIILAAGKGTRMRSDLPKVLHKVGGLPLISHALIAAQALSPVKLAVVTAPDQGSVRRVVAEFDTDCLSVIQPEQLGTGHAVQSAERELKDHTGTVLVLYGDTPLITPDTCNELIKRVEKDHAAVAVLGMYPHEPAQYGRLILSKDGLLERIVEFKDATPDERAIRLCNSGVMAVRGDLLLPLLARLKKNNANGEYYLTDLVALACADGHKCMVVEAAMEEVLGVNSRLELAEAEVIFQDRMREYFMENGVTLLDPGSVYFNYDTQIARDVIIHPQVVFGPGVRVEEEVEIRSFSHLEGAHIKHSAVIGPFARLRPGANIGQGAHIGNFVEIKKSDIASGAKINHLSYVGDANIGERANIGAGTITCNYDGFDKYRTEIGAGAFIGSNTALVAPVNIGAGAVVGAGSVIAEDVEADSLAISRPKQLHKKDWARIFRNKRNN